MLIEILTDTKKNINIEQKYKSNIKLQSYLFYKKVVDAFLDADIPINKM